MKKIFKLLKIHQRFIQLAIGLITIGLAFWILFVNRDDLTRLLEFRLWNLAIIILLYILHFFLTVISLWLIITRISGKSVAIINWIKIMFLSRMANLMVPRSGGLYKAYVLKNEYEINYTKFVHIYAFFSWLTILTNLGLAVMLIFIFMPGLQIGNYPVLFIMSGLFIGILLGPIIANYGFSLIKPKDDFLLNISERISEIFKTMLNHGCDISFMSKLIGALLAKFGLYVLLFKTLFAGMGESLDIGYAQMALFIAVEQINVIIYITPGNIGIMELLYGAISGAIGIGVTEGVIASAILRAIGYVVILPFGIVFGWFKVYRSIKLQSQLGNSN